MSKYDDLKKQYGCPIGISSDKGYIFWDSENKKEVYEEPEHPYSKYGKPENLSIPKAISVGSQFDEHD